MGWCSRRTDGLGVRLSHITSGLESRLPCKLQVKPTSGSPKLQVRRARGGLRGQDRCLGAVVGAVDENSRMKIARAQRGLTRASKLIFLRAHGAVGAGVTSEVAAQQAMLLGMMTGMVVLGTSGRGGVEARALCEGEGR